ncbi:30S ribosomal protein S20 [Candidatus Giovannonibacteria bacterium RIFCSPHIGHO2_01_FULL_48_47]|nr:MAG: 30S ribosomal protein S20 [Candidatus Giovannonibacteria bacterium RIFCSPHIGHO2_01_FULL_48_47]OGF68713.1 MAG: 30S ribosomal protein S20 [Candidatus Giovannonibacteria bacterium RIFCSPHIGHO2_02_FULL_48_15]OGF89629.1 MAG: 30S ribosomal protein S20 [Candidatus Giovannonibacteria bacterium RIFCSPLOWO2_01_FULL_48_47]OGF95134.1 MAG: 30S ribosomal protein S20 [Candidatus Giovannonibacteria bacterium RIFOXYC1_FULL_48_8]OGF96354.1 MAG: 30S ribosomal protein S20 [Candidatus Giovannonibacteria bac
MPIIKSAKKALRQSIRRRERNLARKAALQKVLKTFSRLIKAKKLDEAKSYFPNVQKALDKAAKQNIIKKNTAARKKSRLSKVFSPIPLQT